MRARRGQGLGVRMKSRHGWTSRCSRKNRALTCRAGGPPVQTPATRRLADNPNSGLLGFSSEVQERYEATTSAAQRKERAQFFTPTPVAAFMATLFSRFPKYVRVLDAGAGTGTLAAAVCERILRLRSPRHIELVLYETDPHVAMLLNENIEHCRSILEQSKHRMAYTIRQEDFILTNPQTFHQKMLFDIPSECDGFDLVIMNPPYFKIQKATEYAQVMERIIHGQPNIYALFMAVGAELLRPGGELVAITPRSFCSGLYFRSFRRWFLQRMSLRHIHLFESRTETFRGANVLQESVITLTRRSADRDATITMSTSYGGDLQQTPSTRQTPTARVIDDTCGHMVIRIPEKAEDERIMDLVEAWPKRFPDHGLRVSTGPVVMFRAREFLVSSPNVANAAPLLSLHNVRPFETVWPVHKNGKPTGFKVCPTSLNRRLLVPTENYVLLRRFSAKEERRRLTAACFLKTSTSVPYLALENHLNYVYHAERALTDNETYGLAALFNSALLDRYFRAISGNTQVNATELRTMKFPDLEKLERMGRRVRLVRRFIPRQVELIVLEELGVHTRVQRYVMEFAR